MEDVQLKICLFQLVSLSVAGCIMLTFFCTMVIIMISAVFGTSTI